MDRFEGAVAVDLQDVEKMEAAVLWSTRGEAGADHLPDEDGSVSAAKNLRINPVDQHWDISFWFWAQAM